MKHFVSDELESAIRYAATGDLALHTHRFGDWDGAPECFRREIRAGRDIAHLFGQDEAKLIAMARKLGVKVILVERRGKPSMHIDLCGGPLRRALKMCREAERQAEPSLFLAEVDCHGS